MATAVTLERAKEWLRVDPDFTEDDDLIIGCIEAAEGWVETYTSHVLSPKDIVLHSERYACNRDVYLFPINNTPDGVTYDVRSLYTSYYLKANQSVTLNVGYANYADIPKQLIAAVMKLITYLYEARDAYAIDDNTDVKMLVNQLRRGIVVV